MFQLRWSLCTRSSRSVNGKEAQAIRCSYWAVHAQGGSESINCSLPDITSAVVALSTTPANSCLRLPLTVLLSSASQERESQLQLQVKTKTNLLYHCLPQTVLSLSLSLSATLARTSRVAPFLSASGLCDFKCVFSLISFTVCPWKKSIIFWQFCFLLTADLFPSAKSHKGQQIGEQTYTHHCSCASLIRLLRCVCVCVSAAVISTILQWRWQCQYWSELTRSHFNGATH